jgi:glycerol-3-phosphate dehydrogenase
VKRDLEPFREDVFDLLILGGGITGSGVALDATLNGWRVALIDKADFASGTSSVSSKLVHGGLRYLEHGNFVLVYEALHERRLLLHNAPHLVHPLRFIIPYHQGSRVPPWKWRTGLTLYDLLAGSSNIRRSRPLSLARLRDESPGLSLSGLSGAAEYYDAQMDDARLCIEVLRTASREGARVANYVEAVAFEGVGGEITGVRAVDLVGGKEFHIRARQVLNATGPWVDAVLRMAGDHGGPHLQPTKGVHVIAPPTGLTSAFLLLHPTDGRVLFVIPWPGTPGANGRVLEAKTLIGTTDTQWEQAPEELRVTPEDVEYLLAAYNHYFMPALQADDLLGAFVGVRPLIRFRPGEPSSRSREFQVFESPSGLISVAGGKYTTYRRMAEVITRRISARLKRPYRNRTREWQLDGAPAEPWAEFEHGTVGGLCSRYQLGEDAARHLAYRYGRRALEVAQVLDADPALAEPVVAGEKDMKLEFVYQRREEMAIKPQDFLLRRTRLGLLRPELLNTPPTLVGIGASVRP